MTEVVKTLKAFVKHEGNDEIACLIRGELRVDGELVHTFRRTEYLSEAAVQAATGHLRWDEDDLCAAGGYVRNA